MKIAILVSEGGLMAHFRHFEKVALIDTEELETKKKELLTPPLVEAWLLPCWLQEHDVDVMIVGSMNERAIALFQKAGIKVIAGAPVLSPEELVHRYIADTLIVGQYD